MRRDDHGPYPQAYLITWRGYGTLLPGEPNWVTDSMNIFGDPLPPRSERLAAHARDLSPYPVYRMDERSREIVLQATLNICAQRGWQVFAAHIRTTHGHVVVQAGCNPDVVAAAIKAHASRRLNQAGLGGDRRGKRWAEGASRRYLWTPEQVQAAMEYVLNGQGERMQWYKEGQ